MTDHSPLAVRKCSLHSRTSCQYIKNSQQQQQQYLHHSHHNPRTMVSPLLQQQNHKQQRLQQRQQEQEERDAWWRQAIVKRTMAFVEDDIQHVLRQSPFLLQSQPGAHIALFHRSEIRTGSRIGKGGFSNVYEIVALELNPQYTQLLTREQQGLREQYRAEIQCGQRKLALKHLQERLLRNTSDPKAFQCAASDLAIEAAYMSALHHPNILSVRGLPLHGLESFLEGRHDSYFLILDRLDSTMDQKISYWKNVQDLPLLEKAGLALQLAQALEYLHERGILFRDLKPQNIGFTADGQVQLLDFGLCRELPVRNKNHDRRMMEDTTDEVFEMSGVGTRRYMAVEIVNTSHYNDKADVYSWAMVVWELLSLQKPYATYSIEDHTRWVCQGGERPRLFTSWPLPIRNLLQHCWTTSLAERLSMKEVECLLRSYIQCCRVLDEAEQEGCCVDPVAANEEEDDDDDDVLLHNRPSPHLVKREQERMDMELLSCATELMSCGTEPAAAEVRSFHVVQSDLKYNDHVDYPPQLQQQQSLEPSPFFQQQPHPESPQYQYTDDAFLWKDDHRMGSFTSTHDMSSQASSSGLSDWLSLQSSTVLESVGAGTTTTANTTDASSAFDLESITFPTSPMFSYHHRTKATPTTKRPFHASNHNNNNNNKGRLVTPELQRVASF